MKFLLRYRAAIVFLLIILLIIGIGFTEIVSPSKIAPEHQLVILNPLDKNNKNWKHRRFNKKKTTYQWVHSALGGTVKATGNQSASMLYRNIDMPIANCHTMKWQWYVPQPQQKSDLRTKGKDDAAASVFVMFGNPGVLNLKPVNVLRYTWANRHHRVGDIITGPYQKKHVRTIIKRTGTLDVPSLASEQVDLLKDYKESFGEAPTMNIHGIAIFTDNDDTKEPITAHYGRIILECG